ncbi:hypothetical protein Tco_0105408 [Tanacetum coccineum]
MEILLEPTSNKLLVGLDDDVAASFQQSQIHKPHALTQAFKITEDHKMLREKVMHLIGDVGIEQVCLGAVAMYEGQKVDKGVSVNEYLTETVKRGQQVIEVNQQITIVFEEEDQEVSGLIAAFIPIDPALAFEVKVSAFDVYGVYQIDLYTFCVVEETIAIVLKRIGDFMLGIFQELLIMKSCKKFLRNMGLLRKLRTTLDHKIDQTRKKVQHNKQRQATSLHVNIGGTLSEQRDIQSSSCEDSIKAQTAESSYQNESNLCEIYPEQVKR